MQRYFSAYLDSLSIKRLSLDDTIFIVTDEEVKRISRIERYTIICG